MADITGRILYEDNHLLIVNKLSSEIVQGDKTGDVCLLDDVKAYIKERYHKPGNVYAGLVHRIDRPVSGAVVFAKTSKALSRMTEMVKNRDFEKVYLALVKDAPPQESGLLEDYLRKNESQNKSYVTTSGVKGAKLARLRYRVVGRSDSFYMLEVELLTGRHHQIRAQLSHMGCPIRGDLKYGFPRSNPDGSISLHAHIVRFVHPVTKALVEVKAPLPSGGAWDYFATLL